MLSPTLIGHQVVQVGEPREERLLAAMWVMQAFHGEQFPLQGVVRLIQQRAGDGHPGICEYRIPACLLVPHPASYACTIRRSSCGGHAVCKAPQSLAEGKHPYAPPLSRLVQEGVELGAQALRPALMATLEYMRAGDMLVVWRLDR